MPKYRDALEVGYNLLNNARLQVFNKLPKPQDITQGLTRQEILKRDSWIFMVRENEVLKPYYFDAIANEVRPFGSGIGGGGEKNYYSEVIGNGIDQEIIVYHGLNSLNVTGTVWQPFGSRLYRVNCEMFLIPAAPNQMGFWFSDPPAKSQFIVSIS